MGEKNVTGRFRVGVLMGGKSVEREVSFNSGRTICDHIDFDRYQVVPLFQKYSGELYLLPLKFLHRGKIADFESRLDVEATPVTWEGLKSLVDFIYTAVHGRYAEDGVLQGMLEVLGIPYLGSKVFASACGIDKIFQKGLLRNAGIAVPRDVIFTPRQIRSLSLDQLLEEMNLGGISFPCVVKPMGEGSSLGVSVVFEPDELLPALQLASWKGVTREQAVLVEEKIEGMEFNSVVLRANGGGGWLPLPITEVIPEKGSHFYDYDQKYMPGRSCKITPARCSREISERVQSVCMRVGDALGFSTFYRIDGFISEQGEVFIVDPNTLSGMGPASFLFHQAAEIGMHHSHLINYLIESELKQYGLWGDVLLGQEKSRGNLVETKIEKKRIAVLLGGDSNEREISLVSGRNVCYKLSPSKYDVIPLFVDDQMGLHKLSARLLLQNSTREIADHLDGSTHVEWDALPSLCDFVFVALHGGKGENGSVQGAIEMLELPYNGSGVLASALCMDKHRTNDLLQSVGFDVPGFYLLAKGVWQEHAERNVQPELLSAIEHGLSYPLILKPHDDGCSMYVQKIDSRQELVDALNEYFKTDKKAALLEELVAGMELTCGVIGNDNVQVFPPSQAIAAQGILSIEEKFLPGAGENQTPAPISKEAIDIVQDVLGRAYTALGCKGYVRIDCFYQDAQTSPTGTERVVILEINSLPALTPATCLFHQAAEIGITPMELLDKIIEFGFEIHAPHVRSGAHEHVQRHGA